MTVWIAPVGTPAPAPSPPRHLRVRLWIARHVLRLSVWHEAGAVIDDWQISTRPTCGCPDNGWTNMHLASCPLCMTNTSEPRRTRPQTGTRIDIFTKKDAK